MASALCVPELVSIFPFLANSATLADMTSSDLRKKYLEFFKSRGHIKIPSASLVPVNDPTSLFISSGMQPLVPYLLGAEHPAGKRLVNSQKSFRIEDIEEVGDNRHTTFFEMLGNWSLGDYFKKEQLSWFFEFLVDIVGIAPEKIYVTVFAGDKKDGIPRDEESAEIWKELFARKGVIAKTVELVTEEQGSALGMQDGRIFYYDAKKNWWSRSGLPENMPAGEPGGPDSEVFYEFSSVVHDEKFGAHCHPNCDCGRYMEIGNSVFMEYRKTATGIFEKLPQKNVDFGGGLERMTAASNNDPDVFHINEFRSTLDKIKKSFGWDYGLMSESQKKKMRIVADHLRAAVFMVGDGTRPSNKDRGYILRRILRRAIFNAYKFASGSSFSNLYPLVSATTSSYREYYPELEDRQQEIQSVLEDEELQFREALRRGIKELEKLFPIGEVQRMTSGVQLKAFNRVDPEKAFYIFQTYGFPLDLIQEELAKRSLVVDKEEFEAEFKKHQELSRTSSAGMFKGGLANHTEEVVRLHTATHLMNKALRDVLGEHVWQKGSHITKERTRFDFTHPQKMTSEEIKKVEELVNSWVVRDLAVKKEIMPLEEARKLNAIGAFGEKYGETVSIYTVYDPKTDEVFNPQFFKLSYSGIHGISNQ